MARLRRLYRTAAYLLLALACLMFAAILYASDRYGAFVVIFQILLAGLWLTMALANWRYGRDRRQAGEPPSGESCTEQRSDRRAQQ